MPRWRFWEKEDQPRSLEAAPPRRTATVGQAPPRPPQPQDRASGPPLDAAARERRRAQLERRRDAMLYDVEQGELALRPDNPWRERIALLGEAIATVEADRQALAAAQPAPTFPLPTTPIGGLRATSEEPAEVSFTIGSVDFRFQEETDWDQRGGAVVRGDLRQRSGDAARLVPANTPAELRDALAEHLAASVTVFATDLRDRALSGTPLPTTATLADLAQPCPACGGWKNWRGHCAACAQRDLRRRELDAEAERLVKEQAAEEEERHRWVDRLPIARRRLADAEAELAKLGT